MKLQNICDKIIAQHRFPIIFGNDFMMKMIRELPKKEGIIDNLLHGVDLNPFKEMSNSQYEDPFTMLALDPIIEKLPSIENINYSSDFSPNGDNFGYGCDWPATLSELTSEVAHFV